MKHTKSARENSNAKKGIRDIKSSIGIGAIGLYVAIVIISNIASTKLIAIGKFITDAGFLYYFLFTLRDLIHKQLGKKAVIATIWAATIANIIAAIYFQLVLILPGESGWISYGGQKAWHLIFGLQLRVTIGSIVAFLLSELVDTYVYEWWTNGIGKNLGQWLRVFVSNAFSIPVDTIVFVIIAFYGVTQNLMPLILSNTLLKAIMTLLTFWTIYLVPERASQSKEL